MQRTILPLVALLVASTAWLGVPLSGCDDSQCRRASDCPAGHYCQGGRCIPFDGGLPDADVPPDVADQGEEGGELPDADGGNDDGSESGDGGCTSHEQCLDDNPCTVDECLMAEGRCRHEPRADGEFCNDDQFCNGFETCQEGRCVSSGDPCGGPVGNPCAAGACDEALDDCRAEPAADGVSCDNGMYCDGAEVCEGGVCRSEGPPCGSDADPCQVNTCTEETHACTSVPLPDGTTCDDGDPCNGSDACLEGVCVRDPYHPCDDWNPCTRDVCSIGGDGSVSCTWEPAAGGGSCTDIDPCAGSAGRILVCLPSGEGACTAGADAPCADGSLCVQTECRGGTCTVADPAPDLPRLEAGLPVSDATVFGPNDVSDYGPRCGAGWTGGERAFEVTVPSGSTRLEVSLGDVTATGALAVLVLADLCDPTSCLGVSPADSPLQVDVTGGRTYYVVVDGRDGARGYFAVSAATR